MTLYSPQDEETLFAHRQARSWRSSGLISGAQFAAMEGELVSGLRSTHLIFRILFFVFTFLGAGAAVGLCAWLFRDASEIIVAFLLVLCGAVCYGAAEGLVQKKNLYRHGIEEALALCAVGFCCAGGAWLLSEAGMGHTGISRFAALSASAGAFWIYLRFGYLWAAGLAAFALCWLPFTFSLSFVTERCILAALLTCLWGAAFLGGRQSAFDVLRDRNATLQTALLAALYLTVNLHLLGLIDLLVEEAGIRHASPSVYPPWFYWTSYAITWAMSVAVFLYGMKSRKRLIRIAGAGMIAATLATNKSYLEISRYSWDPAILGLALVAVFFFLSRWLDAGPDRKRFGYTAQDILKTPEEGIRLTDVASALVPGAIEAVRPEAPAGPDYFKGGASGGGGAGREY